MLDEVGADAARVAVAHAGHAERARAAGRATREHVRVEELTGPEHRTADDRERRDPRQQRVARRDVAVSPAIHQVGRASGAQVRVVQHLEHGQRIARQMRRVHVVDRVRELAREAEAQRGAEARPVLDVAALATVVPVHRRDVVAVGSEAGRDRRGADRRHQGNTETASRMNQPRSTSAASAGVRPAWRARSNIAGAAPSITARTTLRARALRRRPSAPWARAFAKLRRPHRALPWFVLQLTSMTSASQRRVEESGR